MLFNVVYAPTKTCFPKQSDNIFSSISFVNLNPKSLLLQLFIINALLDKEYTVYISPYFLKLLMICV